VATDRRRRAGGDEPAPFDASLNCPFGHEPWP
jgi:hypothetical protein